MDLKDRSLSTERLQTGTETDPRLAGLSPDVLDTINEDDLLFVEDQMLSMMAYSDLVVSECPFIYNPTTHSDRPLMDVVPNRLQQKTTEMLSIDESAIALTAARARTLANRSYSISSKLQYNLMRTTLAAGKIVRSAAASFSSNLLKRDSPAEEVAPVDVVDIKNGLDELKIAADKLPSPKDMGAFEELIQKRSRFLDLFWSGPKRTLWYGSANLPEFTRKVGAESLLGPLKVLKSAIAEAKDIGKEVHRNLTGLAANEQVRVAAETVSFLHQIKGYLGVSYNDASSDADRQKALAVEAYLAERADAIYQLLRQGGQTDMDKLACKQELIELLKRPIQTAEETRKDADVDNRFGRQITEARDIIVGWHRLKVLPSISDAVEKLVQQVAKSVGTNPKPEEVISESNKGILIAIVSGKFIDFKQTLNRVKAVETDEDRDYLATTRKKAVDIIKGFDLDAEILDLNRLLQRKGIFNSAKSRATPVVGGLSNKQVEDVRLTLAQHIEAVRTQAEAS